MRHFSHDLDSHYTDMKAENQYSTQNNAGKALYLNKYYNYMIDIYPLLL